jgi:hypothetical protein
MKHANFVMIKITYRQLNDFEMQRNAEFGTFMRLSI